MNFDASKIKEQTNNLIAYELYERSENLKKHKLKTMSFIILSIMLLIVGTFTVNAMTDNAITNTIKDAFKINVNDKDYNAKCEKLSNGNLKCSLGEEVLEKGTETSFEINKDYVDKIDASLKDNILEFSIKSE